MCEPGSPESHRPRETDCGSFGSAEPVTLSHADIVALELSMIGFPGVVEDGMPGGMCSESPEPLAGRLGAPAQRRHPKALQIAMCLRVGRMGPIK